MTVLGDLLQRDPDAIRRSLGPIFSAPKPPRARPARRLPRAYRYPLSYLIAQLGGDLLVGVIGLGLGLMLTGIALALFAPAIRL